MQNIGEKIYSLRKKMGLSQEELGDELGVSRQTVHKWENNLMQPNADSIRLLCSYFDVDANYFIHNNDCLEEVAATVIEDSKSKQDVICEPKGNKKNNKIVLITLIVLSVLVSTSAIIFIIITAFCGCAVFSENIGFDKVTTISPDTTTFAILLVTSVFLTILSILILIYIPKRKCK